MKKFARALVLTCVLANALVSGAQEKTYAVIDYMRIPEGQSREEYLALEKLWQRLHQKSVDAGNCLGWHLFRLENNPRYQFATVQVYDSIDKFAQRWPDSMWEGLYSNEESARMNRTGTVRELGRREVWTMVAGASQSGDEAFSTPIYMHLIKTKPGKTGQYVAMERDLYQKVHQARINAGQLKSWFCISRMFPGGSDSDYDFATLNSYPAGKGQSWDAKLAESALSKEEWEKANNPDEVRTIIGQQVWHQLLRTTAPKDATKK
jgi:hypothetical protein